VGLDTSHLTHTHGCLHVRANTQAEMRLAEEMVRVGSYLHESSRVPLKALVEDRLLGKCTFGWARGSECVC
jgi:hypothetical protein